MCVQSVHLVVVIINDACVFAMADSTGVVLYSHPYQLCVLPQFISSIEEDFLQQLSDEIRRLKFTEKNNDLYQFRQVSVCGGQSHVQHTCLCDPVHVLSSLSLLRKSLPISLPIAEYFLTNFLPIKWLHIYTPAFIGTTTISLVSFFV